MKPALAAQVWEYLGLCLTLGTVTFPSYGCGGTALAKTQRTVPLPWVASAYSPHGAFTWYPLKKLMPGTWDSFLIIGLSSVFFGSFRWGQGLPHVHRNLPCCMCSTAVALLPLEALSTLWHFCLSKTCYHFWFKIHFRIADFFWWPGSLMPFTQYVSRSRAALICSVSVHI